MCGPFCWKCVVCQDRWSLTAVVSQDRLHVLYLTIHKQYMYLHVCTRCIREQFHVWLPPQGHHHHVPLLTNTLTFLSSLASSRTDVSSWRRMNSRKFCQLTDGLWRFHRHWNHRTITLLSREIRQSNVSWSFVMRESIEQNQTIGSPEISRYIFKAWGSLIKTCMCCHGPLYMIEYKLH